MSHRDAPTAAAIDEARRAAAAWERAVLDRAPTADVRRRFDRALDALASDPALVTAFEDGLARRIRPLVAAEAGRVRHDAGRRAGRVGDPGAALVAFAEARDLLSGESIDLAAVAQDSAEVLIDLGDIDAAAFQLENARAYWTIVGSRAGRGDAGLMLGDCYAARGRRREASEAYRHAAADYETAGLAADADRCRILAAVLAAAP